MNVYVETNFVLELAFVQEQHEACAKIVELCRGESARLVLPAFCIAESYERLIRQAKDRAQIAGDLARELRQLSRSKPYENEVETLQAVTGLLARSSQDEDQRLIDVLGQLLVVADIIPLEAKVLLSAAQHRVNFALKPQDSIVYSSVLHHLASARGVESCFINRNRRDFDDPDIEETLTSQGCKMLFSFDNGYKYIQHRMSTA